MITTILGFEGCKWEILCGTPVQAVVPLVREFYVNANRERTIGLTMNAISWVSRKMVKFGRHRLNTTLSLPNLEQCVYWENIYRPVTIEEVNGVIVTPDSEWEMSKGKPLKLKEVRLMDRTRVVHKFVCTR